MIATLIKLLISFFKVGAFSFGGAYSLIPLIEKEAVDLNHWLTPDEFLKVLGMVDVFPGAISIKYATFIGYKAAGIPGAIVANIGNLLVPVTLMIFAFIFYSKFEKNVYVEKAFQGIKFAVVGMVIGIMFQYFFKSSFQWQSLIFVAVGLILILTLKLHPAFVVIAEALLALIIL
ncbi:Chromate transport protein [hydrothermal vent metagenome]|uniref:Chromate transport protein n=1 Tax=hydrothermal vent metagenome TaxID=652676 RepID=A0A3B1CSE3_9ZZZZ